jgi:hypothetical protein
MSQVLRSFIRESLVVEIGGSRSYAVDMPYDIPSEPVESYVGILGSFNSGRQPDYVVVADNRKDRVVIRKHSKSPFLDNDEQYVRNLNAKKIDISDALLDILANARNVPHEMDDNGYRTDAGQIGTWGMLDYDQAQLVTDISHESSKTLRDYFLVEREKIEKSSHPSIEYTDLYKQNLLDFKCNLDISKAIYYITTYEPTTPEYALGAACFYTYATENKYTIPAVLIGVVSGAFLGGPPGALAGAGAAFSIQEIICRIVVARWARANGLDDFYVANIVYIFVNVFFLALSSLKEIEMLSGGALLEKLTGPFQRITKILGITKLPTATSWSAIVPFLAEMIIQFAAFFNESYEIALHKNKIEAYLNDPDKIDADVSASIKQLFDTASKKYPSR